MDWCCVCQLEDAELATAAAVKARKAMELELQDLQSQFDAVSKAKQEVCPASSKLLVNHAVHMYIHCSFHASLGWTYAPQLVVVVVLLAHKQSS